MAALVAVLLLCLPAAAWAASVTLVAPTDGTIRDRTEVRIDVRRGDLEYVKAAQARPRSGGPWVDLECKSNCNLRENPRTRTYAFEMDPRSGAPFFERAPANGRLEIELRLSVEQFGSGTQTRGPIELVLDVPGSPVTGLNAESVDRGLRISWTRAPEPDITGYRVRRTDASGSSVVIAELDQSASSVSDDPPPGTYTYEVVTIRPSGRSGSLETSSTVEATIAAPEPEPTDPPTEPSDGGNGGNGDGNNGGNNGRGGNGGSNGGGSNGGGSGGDANGNGGNSGGSSTGSSRNRAAPRAPTAPSVRFGSRGIPSLGELAEGFRGSLDYGAELPEAAGDPADGDDDEVVLANPSSGGAGSVIDRLTDPNRVAVPIAGGLLLTAVGLHLWRWLKVPLV